MKIIIQDDSPADILSEITSWLRRAAQSEISFAQAAYGGKRRREKSEYAANCINNLADTLATMDVEMRTQE